MAFQVVLDWILAHWSLLDNICFFVRLHFVIFHNIFGYEFQITIRASMLALPGIDLDFKQTFFCLVFSNHMIEECFKCGNFFEFHITEFALIPLDILPKAFDF